jgi:hypothetical protein
MRAAGSFPETARRLERDKVDVTLQGEHRMRIAPSICNDDTDVDALLRALS